MVKAVQNGWFNRTFKREVAVTLLLFWCMLTIKLFWFAPVEFIGVLGTAYGTASTMVGMFAAAAFGMDAVSKQWPATQDSTPPRNNKPRKVTENQPAYD